MQFPLTAAPRLRRMQASLIVNGIKGIELADDGSAVSAQRESSSGFEVYHLALPAVLGVKEVINLRQASASFLDSFPMESHVRSSEW